MSFKYSKEIKEQAISLYKQGVPAAQIANIIKANEATIRTWLKQANIQIRKGGTYSKIHDEEILNKIIGLYNLGIYTPDIEKQLGLKKGVASYLLRKNNISLRHRGPKSKIGKEDFFDNIDAEEKAYFLGWIIADGNVSITKGQYSLKLHIALEDKEIIDNFLKAIESENATKIKQGDNPSYYASLTSVHLIKRLIELGVTPRKSGFEVFPKDIPESLINHLIRGIFDGDGITDIKRKRSGFVGSKDVVKTILELLDEDLTMFCNSKNKNIFYFLGGKKFSRKLYDYLYNDASVWLERKRHRLKIICFE